METIRIAVGSKRAPKLEAVRQALKSLGPLLRANATFEVTGFEVATGVGHTPLSRDELMAGARGRCEAARRASGYGAPAYFVGLEGGLDVVRENGRRLAFLQSWAFAADAGGRGFYGQSGAILLPEALAAEVFDRGAELSQAIEAFTGTTGVRDSQGAWGVLTKRPDRSAGVVPDRGDQRVCALFQRGDVWQQRGQGLKPRSFGRLMSWLKPRPTKQRSKGPWIRARKRTADPTAKAPGPPTETVGAPWATNESDRSQGETWLRSR